MKTHTVYLYATRIKNGRKSDPEFVRTFTVEHSTYEAVARNYTVDIPAITGRTDNASVRYHLRASKIVETTDNERKALHAAHDRLKATGKLPSALETIMNRAVRD